MRSPFLYSSRFWLEAAFTALTIVRLSFDLTLSGSFPTIVLIRLH